MSIEHLNKFDNDVDYAFESNTEDKKMEQKESLTVQTKVVSNLNLWLHMSLLSLHALSCSIPCIELKQNSISIVLNITTFSCAHSCARLTIITHS